MINADNQAIISIIVPVYNVEPYLRECLDSIVIQSFTDWELILINDGSSDLSGNICNEYAATDGRIRVFHQQNLGQSAARNVGLDNMSGKYVTMVDSDDVLISNDYLKLMYDSLIQNDAEMSICRLAILKKEKDIPSTCGDVRSTFIRSGEDYSFWRNIPSGFLPNSAATKMYQASLFDNIRYPEGRIFEDIAIQHKLTFPCKRIAFVEASLYGYRRRSDGTEWGTPIDIRARDIVYAFQDRINYYNSANRPDLADRAEQSMLLWLRRHL